MIKVVKHGVAPTVLDLAKAVELDLHLMVGNRGVLGAPYSTLLLLDYVEQAEGVARRLEVIEVSRFSYLVSEVIVSEPYDGGEHLT